MPNALYAGMGAGLSLGEINWPKDEVRLLLVNTQNYTPDLAKHVTLADVAKTARVFTSQPLSGKVVDGFSWAADDLTLERVTGPLCQGAILFQKRPYEWQSRLLMWVEDAEFLPFLPNGGDLKIVWPNPLLRF